MEIFINERIKSHLPKLSEESFSQLEANILRVNDGYETHSLAVPVERLMAGMTSAMSVKWAD